MRLIGPGATFGGLKTSPYYYYFFAPIFYVSNYSVNAFLYTNSLMFASVAALSFHYISRHINRWYAILITLILYLSPVFVFAARNPGNAYSYLPFLLLFWIFVIGHNLGKNSLALLGFGMGIVATTHYSNVLSFVIMFLYLVTTIPVKRHILYFLAGFFLSLSPLLFFELRHGFIMTTNTLFVKSYTPFINNTLLPGSEVPPKNIFLNVFFIISKIGSIFGINILILSLIAGLTLVFRKTRKDTLATACVLVLLSLAAILLRFQFVPHYLYAIGTIIIFLETYQIATSQKLVPMLFIIFIVMLSHFPQSTYSASTRTADEFEKTVTYIIENHIIKKPLSFNIIQLRPAIASTPHGNEYRYYFEKRGLIPKKPDEYASSEQLIVISEIMDPSVINKARSWEFDQFGTAFFKNAKIYRTKSRILYSIVKQS